MKKATGIEKPAAPARKIVLSDQPGDPPAPKEMSADAFLSAVGVKIDDTKKAKKNGILTLTPPSSDCPACKGTGKGLSVTVGAGAELEKCVVCHGSGKYSSLRATVDQIVDWKKREKEAKAERETKEAELIDYVRPIQNEAAFKGDFQKSFYVKGETQIVTFVSADKFSAPKLEDIKELETLLGHRFGEFVEKETTMEVKDEVIKNPELLLELRKKIGDENFTKYFDLGQKYVVKEGFDRRRFSLNQETFEKVNEIIVQAKPSVK